MSIPPEQAKSAIGGLTGAGAAAGSTAGINMGGQNTQANVGQAAALQQAPMAVQIAAHNALMQLIDGRIAAVIAATKATESKVVTFAKKYWPIAAGVAVAATRLIH